MMGALVAGGMVGNYDKERQQRIIAQQECMEWPINPKGFYEHPVVPIEEAHEMVTKALFASEIPEDCKLIWMQRSRLERAESYQRLMDFDPLDPEEEPPAGATVIKMRTLVLEPERVYNHLVRLGWPIPNKTGFCGFPDPSIYRCREENILRDRMASQAVRRLVREED